jgi:hypothetical protein
MTMENTKIAATVALVAEALDRSDSVGWTIVTDNAVRFLDVSDEHGARIYRAIIVREEAPDALPEGAEAIIASFEEGSMTREEAETDLTLCGMNQAAIARALYWTEPPMPPAPKLVTEFPPCQPLAPPVRPIGRYRHELLMLGGEAALLEQTIANAHHFGASETRMVFERMAKVLTGVIAALQGEAIDQELRDAKGGDA